jgi:hypothetical protein
MKKKKTVNMENTLKTTYPEHGKPHSITSLI